MKNSSNPSVAGKGDVCRLIAEAVLPYVLQQLQASGLLSPTYYHQDDSPLGRRRHLELVRRGVLRGHKIGKRVLVLCVDVHACIEMQPTAGAPEAEGDPLDDWGLRRKGGS